MTLEDKDLVRDMGNQLRERFGKDSLNAKEFGKYLGKNPMYVAEKIRRREFPGYCDGHTFTIPVDSIALWIVRLSKTKDT